MKVITIVVTYNRKELLKESIIALLNQKYKDNVIFIVDNASTDNTYEYISSFIDNNKIHYFNTGSNIGGAGGFNFGIKQALKYDANFFWLMDDDCIVHEDSLSNLIDYANRYPNFGFLSSKVLWKDNSLCKMNIQKKSYLRKITNNNRVQKIKSATFVSFFVKKEVVIDVGLPIKDFFIWGDDIEYSLRISSKYHCYYIPDSIVTHKSNQNIGSNIATDKDTNLNRYKYAYRNEKYLFSKLGIKGKLYFFFKIKKHIYKIKHSKLNINNKKERIQLIKDSIKEGKLFNPKIEKN